MCQEQLINNEISRLFRSNDIVAYTTIITSAITSSGLNKDKGVSDLRSISAPSAG